jgi:hypothetical protein
MSHILSGRVRATILGAMSVCLAAGGLALVSSGTAGAGPNPPPLDHFLCYQARGAGFKIPGTVQVKNQIQPNLFIPKFGTVAAHCNPANKIVPAARFIAKNPLAHLLCWGISATWTPRKVTMHNQFGKGVMLTGASPSSLCLPSWKSNVAPPNMAVNQPPGLDHFTCYPVSFLPGTTSTFKPPSVVKAQDEFNAPLYTALKLSNARQLCVPSTKIVTANPATGPVVYPPMTDVDLSLLCFPTSPTPWWKLVYDQNQFGQGPVGIPRPTTATERFCVPTTIDSVQ